MLHLYLFFLWYFHAHSHIINTHAHPHTWGGTLKREMNMSSVNFDWHLFFIYRARIYGALYTYLNELLTIKNSLKHSWGVRWRWVNTSHLQVTPQLIAIHLLLHKHKQNQREMHAHYCSDTYGEIWHDSRLVHLRSSCKPQPQFTTLGHSGAPLGIKRKKYYIAQTTNMIAGMLQRVITLLGGAEESFRIPLNSLNKPIVDKNYPFLKKKCNM